MYVVYVDLDDTLLDDEKRISDYTYEVLKTFISQGNTIVITTARSRQLSGLQDNIKSLTPYYILHNGGEIIVDDKIAYRKYFTNKETQKIGDYLTRKKIKAAVILDNEYYANYDAQAIWGKINNFNYTVFETASISAPKFSVLLEDNNQINEVKALNEIARVTFIDSSSTAIIAPLYSSKGTAIKYLQKKCFANLKSIYIGNDYNDISGFEVCDVKIAVENAEDEVLKLADEVIGSNSNEGVAHYLERFIK